MDSVGFNILHVIYYCMNEVSQTV